jgi:Tol biopolymer transport system component
MKVGDSINLYRVGFDGAKVPLTQGTGSETSPVVSSEGRLIFTRTEQTPRILSIGLDGMNEQASVEAAPGDFFGTSRDGKTLVYRRMTGMVKGNLVLRERSSGTETTIAVHDELPLGGIGSLWPQVSPDGTRVIYRALANPSGHYQVSTTGGASKFVIAITRFNLATDWSPDGKRVIGECAPTTDGICALDVDVAEVSTLLKDARGGELLYPSYSWDGKWVVFMLRRAGRTVICVTPVRDGSLRGESEWVQISPETADASRPRFSPNGASIYYELVQGTLAAL